MRIRSLHMAAARSGREGTELAFDVGLESEMFDRA